MKNTKSFSPSASTFPLIPLESVSVASPCPADWNAMQGDDHARFCKTCAKNVYNLSAMTRNEAEALIRAKEGHLCIRYYQRADGTILTQDCPVGLMAASPKLNGRFKLWGETANLFMLCGALIAGLVTLPALLNAAENHRKAPNVVEMGEMPVVAGGISVAVPKPTTPPATNNHIMGDMQVTMGKPIMGAPPVVKPTSKPKKQKHTKPTVKKNTSAKRS